MITALGRVGGRADTIEVLRDSGCSTMVIREDLCDPRDFTGETRGCVMMDGKSCRGSSSKEESGYSILHR